MHPCGGCHRDSQSLVFIGILRLARAVQFLPATRSTRNAASCPRRRKEGLAMTPSLHPKPESERPENADAEACEFFDEAQVEAFCEELLAALTKLERSSAAGSARARGRFN